MTYKDKYIAKLEALITNDLLPIYNKYYELIEQKAPDIDISILTNVKKKKIPVLLRGFDV